ncbi:MAG: hypothetical protein ACI87E_001304 [Mariniblastus sp.]|jgi:hypothetical protein
MYSFLKSKPIVDAAPRIRRIIDLTTPNMPTVNDGRNARRYNRSISVVIADWDPEKGPDLSRLGFGFTIDLSDTGFALLTQFVPQTPDNIVGFYLPHTEIGEPSYFHVEFIGYSQKVQGFKRISYRVKEFLNENHGCKSSLLTPKLIEILGHTAGKGVDG